MMPTIDRDVPIPGRHRITRRYPFPEMGVGDSFRIAVPRGDDAITVMRRISGAAGAFSGRHEGFHFVTRVVEDGKAVRVWRTASA